MEAINGSVIKPGATWSFNKSTGDTTTGELGYVKSSAIVNGKAAYYGLKPIHL